MDTILKSCPLLLYVEMNLQSVATAIAMEHIILSKTWKTMHIWRRRIWQHTGSNERNASTRVQWSSNIPSKSIKTGI